MDKCEEIGCKNRLIVIDGNEKLYRYSCAKPCVKMIGDKGSIKVVGRCINNPIRGNQFNNGSKYCHFHLPGTSSKELSTDEQLDLRPITRQSTRNLQDKIVSGFGCKDEKNVNKFQERTAGMLYLIRPCGIRLSHVEMYTAESLSAVFSSLIDVFFQPT